MAYNPGITNRSGEILAQGIASAAQTRMQGYQNATNSLLKGFADLTKKQQEDELQIRDANARLSSDPELEKKIRASGNTKLIAQLDKFQTPETGTMNKFFGSGKGSDAKDIIEYGKGLDTAEAKETSRELRRLQGLEAGYRKDAADRLTATDAENLRMTKMLQTKYGPAASLMNNSSLTPTPRQNTPYNPTDFTAPFNPPSNVPPTGVSSFLANQSNMLRDNLNPPATPPFEYVKDNSFIQTPRETPMDMSARNIAQTLPTFDRNDGDGGSQVVAEKPVDNSLLANLVRSGVPLNKEIVAQAILKQAEMDNDNRKLKPEGSTGKFTDRNGLIRTYVVRNGETVDFLTGLPLQSVEADAYGNRSSSPTRFPEIGVGMGTGTGRSAKFPGSDITGFNSAGDGNIKKFTTMSGIDYIKRTTP